MRLGLLWRHGGRRFECGEQTGMSSMSPTTTSSESPPGLRSMPTPSAPSDLNARTSPPSRAPMHSTVSPSSEARRPPVRSRIAVSIWVTTCACRPTSTARICSIRCGSIAAFESFDF